jgi:hypothetical protein
VKPAFHIYEGNSLRRAEDFSWDMNGDLGNVLQLTLGVASLVAAPWVAAGFGAVSVGIAIYSATHPCN